MAEKYTQINYYHFLNFFIHLLFIQFYLTIINFSNKNRYFNFNVISFLLIYRIFYLFQAKMYILPLLIILFLQPLCVFIHGHFKLIFPSFIYFFFYKNLYNFFFFCLIKLFPSRNILLIAFLFIFLNSYLISNHIIIIRFIIWNIF